MCFLKYGDRHPEIWSTTDRIFCYLGPFFSLLLHWRPGKSKLWKNGKNFWRYYYFIPACDEQNFFSFWIIFCRFASITTQKIRFSKKQKKTPGDIIILHLCTINGNHMMNGSWDMERDGQNFFCHFGPFFALLPH